MTPNQLIESLQSKIPPELMDVDILLMTLDDNLIKKYDLLAFTGLLKCKDKSCVILGSQDSAGILHEDGNFKYAKE